MKLGKDTIQNRKSNAKAASFLSRLRRDQRGNVLAIVAASAIPVIGAVGGGVDLTRAYMAEARLAQTCDAAALAGRKVMTDADVNEDGEVIAGTTTDQEIQRFIDYNFPEGTFNAAPLTRSAAVNDEGELSISLASTLPTQLLPILGIDTLSIDADCSARRSGVNVDVVLVVDVTGSMNTSLGGTTRLGALKSATLSFLDTLDDLRVQLAASGTRVRTAIVPYSTTVNVGLDLIEDEPNPGDYVNRDAAIYNSRNVLVQQCTASNSYCGTSNSSINGRYRHRNDLGRRGDVTLDLTGFVDRGLADGGDITNAYNWKGCIEMRQTIQSINSSTSLDSIPAGAWDIIDKAPGVDGAPKWQPYIMLPTEDSADGRYAHPTSGPATTDPTFQRLTLPSHLTTRVPYRHNSLTTAYTAPPTMLRSQATSLLPSGTGPNNTCNTRVKTLSEATRDDLESYVNSLTADGGTYHDVGMYWGLALISPQAPFENPDSYLAPGFTGEERGVKRYIVFMTDGKIEPFASYSAWGYEGAPSSVGNHTVSSDTDTNRTNAHRRRFRMLCEEAKRSGIEVSTVIFATSLGTADETAVKECATSTDHYYKTDTASGLEDTFKKIAQNIGYLRVSK